MLDRLKEKGREIQLHNPYQTKCDTYRLSVKRWEKIFPANDKKKKKTKKKMKKKKTKKKTTKTMKKTTKKTKMKTEKEKEKKKKEVWIMSTGKKEQKVSTL